MSLSLKSTKQNLKISKKMSPVSNTQFKKGDHVEVIKRENATDTVSYYAATVLKLSSSPPSVRKDQVLIEYLTLIIDSQSDGPEHMRELVDFSNVRPTVPREINECFTVSDAVDVYCDNGWHKGTVKDILENSKFVVGFDGNQSEGVVADQCNLRLHRDWVHGSWVPPLLKQKKLSSTEAKSKKIRLKIQYSKRKSEPKFKKGTTVEVKSDEEGYQGAWYSAVIVGSVGDDKFLVQYLTLLTDDETAPLREVASIHNIRPWPLQVSSVVRFKWLENVDAWFNEGWWEGVISQVLNGSQYMVYFSSTHDNLEFDHSNLRPHQDWINGKWVKRKSTELKGNERSPKANFSSGTKVEVKSDEVGFQGAWFAAIIVDVMGNDKFLVQYQNLITDDENNFLREEASALDIRPYPPQIQRVYPFELFEIVDAWYNDGWWVGRIIKVQDKLKYTVLFRMAEELEFEHCELRPHQEWIDGNWFPVPKDWEF